MACQCKDVPEDIKPPLNMGSDSDPNRSAILAEIKQEMGEYDGSTGIKVEHDIFTSDTKSFQPAMIKIEGDGEFPEFEFKYNKDEPEYIHLEEGTTSSRNMENNFIVDDAAGPSSSYELTPVIKMEQDEDITSGSSEGEDRESDQHGGKPEKTFDCIRCRKEFSSKRDLDGHIVTRHSNDSEMMNSVTSKIHQCEHCKYLTVHATNFARHMRKHGEKLEKTFDCIKCRKEFSNKVGLDDHIVIRHSNNDEMMSSVTCKIRRCKYCSYITVKVDHLNKHMRSHGLKPEKTFDCIKCRKKFLSKFNLDSHIVTRHSNNAEIMNSVTSIIHRCRLCRYITVIKRSLNTHMNKHARKNSRLVINN